MAGLKSKTIQEDREQIERQQILLMNELNTLKEESKQSLTQSLESQNVRATNKAQNQISSESRAQSSNLTAKEQERLNRLNRELGRSERGARHGAHPSLSQSAANLESGQQLTGSSQ